MSEEIRNSNPIATCAAMLVLIILVWFVCVSCVDGICLEVDRQREHEPAPAYARPAAFRMASPTQEQMDAYHGIVTVMEVNR